MPTELASTANVQPVAPDKSAAAAPLTVIGELRKILASLVGL